MFSNRSRPSTLSAFHPILRTNRNTFNKFTRRPYPINNGTKVHGTDGLKRYIDCVLANFNSLFICLVEKNEQKNTFVNIVIVILPNHIIY